MKISLIQMDSRDNKQENIEKAFRFMNESVKQNVDIICLSEKFLYWGKDRGAEDINSSIIENFKEYAKNNNELLIMNFFCAKFYRIETNFLMSNNH